MGTAPAGRLAGCPRKGCCPRNGCCPDGGIATGRGGCSLVVAKLVGVICVALRHRLREEDGGVAPHAAAALHPGAICEYVWVGGGNSPGSLVGVRGSSPLTTAEGRATQEELCRRWRAARKAAQQAYARKMGGAHASAPCSACSEARARRAARTLASSGGVAGRRPVRRSFASCQHAIASAWRAERGAQGLGGAHEEL